MVDSQEREQLERTSGVGGELGSILMRHLGPGIIAMDQKSGDLNGTYFSNDRSLDADQERPV
jgi:hypothetical protein